MTRTRRALLRDLARFGGVAFGLGLFGGCAPAPAAAPSSARVYRVGLLRRGLDDDLLGGALEHLRERLRELGYVEGQNLPFEERQVTEFADNSQDRFYAAELAQMPLDAIVAPGVAAPQAAAAAMSSIPIVIVGTPDPIGAGLADSLARPGRNVTGVAGGGIELEGKRLQLLVEAISGISTVATLGGAPPPPLRSAAESLGVTLMVLPADSAETYEPALTGAIADGANALLVRGGLGTNPNARLIGGLSVQLRIPAVFPNRTFVVGGGLMSYEPSAAEIGRRAADYLDRILRGARPSDLPIELPRRFELVVNMRTARALGLTLPPSFMVQVDEMIE